MLDSSSWIYEDNNSLLEMQSMEYFPKILGNWQEFKAINNKLLIKFKLELLSSTTELEMHKSCTSYTKKQVENADKWLKALFKDGGNWIRLITLVSAQNFILLFFKQN